MCACVHMCGCRVVCVCGMYCICHDHGVTLSGPECTCRIQKLILERKNAKSLANAITDCSTNSLILANGLCNKEYNRPR